MNKNSDIELDNIKINGPEIHFIPRKDKKLLYILCVPPAVVTVLFTVIIFIVNDSITISFIEFEFEINYKQIMCAIAIFSFFILQIMRWIWQIRIGINDVFIIVQQGPFTVKIPFVSIIKVSRNNSKKFCSTAFSTPRIAILTQNRSRPITYLSLEDETDFIEILKKRSQHTEYKDL